MAATSPSPSPFTLIQVPAAAGRHRTLDGLEDAIAPVCMHGCMRACACMHAHACMHACLDGLEDAIALRGAQHIIEQQYTLPH